MTWIAALIITPSLICGMIQVESSGNPKAVSSAGAIGLMQVKPSTAAIYGVKGRELVDPGRNIYAARCYISDLLRMKSLSISRALTAYNWGPYAKRTNNTYANKVLKAQVKCQERGID